MATEFENLRIYSLCSMTPTRSKLKNQSTKNQKPETRNQKPETKNQFKIIK